MELSQLIYFCATAHAEHFTHAAEQLHITQPSLSKAISNLEEELGVPLFDREKRSVHLNGYGRAFLARAEQALSILDDAQTELRDMRDGAGGTISIASSFLLDTPDNLASFIRSFYFSHPNIHIQTYYLDIPAMAGLLRSRGVDFALSAGRFDLPDMEERELYRYKLGIIVNRNHPLAKRKQVCLKELSDCWFLTNSSAPDMRDTIYDICFKAGFRPKIAFSCDNSDLIGEAASRGLGITFANEHRFQYNSVNGLQDNPWKKELVFVPVQDSFCNRTISIAYLKNCYLTTAARMFLDELIAYASADQLLQQ